MLDREVGADGRDVQHEREGRQDQSHGEDGDPEPDGDQEHHPRLNVLKAFEGEQTCQARGDGSHQGVGNRDAPSEAAVDHQDASHQADQQLLRGASNAVGVQGLQHFLGSFDVDLHVVIRAALVRSGLLGIALLGVLVLLVLGLLGLWRRSVSLSFVFDLLQVLVDGRHSGDEDGSEELCAQDQVLELRAVEDQYEAQEREHEFLLGAQHGHILV
mmetsp:Transcript_6798/g.9695  ORF Transcript_6798/g.9695 Transcript_6798/m.9695 type:complete len:215 (+) Transcript_6798:450-1094(+)